MYISVLYSSKSFNLPSTLYDEPKLLSDRRNACKYHKHIRLYTIKISSKTILFIKTHGSKGKGRVRPRGQGRRAAARGRGRGQGGRGRAAAGQNRIELAMQARQNRQTQIEVHDLKYVSLPYTYTKERTTRSLIKNKFITCMEHIC